MNVTRPYVAARQAQSCVPPATQGATSSVPKPLPGKCCITTNIGTWLQHHQQAQMMQLNNRSYSHVCTAGFGFGLVKQKNCPCGSNTPYKDCCQQYHKNSMLHAPTAEATLRARFSAYVKKEVPYIVRTTHDDNPNKKGSVSSDGKLKTTFQEDVKVSMYNFDFQNLQVHSVQEGQTQDEQIIDFELQFLQKIDKNAKKLDKPIPQSLRERATFVREQGQWLFLKADSNWSREELTVAEPVAA